MLIYWYEGTFTYFPSGSLAYSVQKFPDSFLMGVEYNKKGDVIKVY
ncbi:hypothetical protein [Caloramator quimbayensis]|nr:hypothetical protein [Caloramator quimbayensis]